MIALKNAIVCEGAYDKIRLSNLFDTEIVITDGFGIRKDREKLAFLKKLAQSAPLILLLDSDAAGFSIRSFLTQSLPENRVIQVYVPDLFGKEKRKAKPGKEGKLGVEGIPDDLILQAFCKAGVLDDAFQPVSAPPAVSSFVTPARLYADGFLGTSDAAEKRRALCSLLELPARLNTSSLCRMLNRMLTEETYVRLISQIK